MMTKCIPIWPKHESDKQDPNDMKPNMIELPDDSIEKKATESAGLIEIRCSLDIGNCHVYDTLAFSRVFFEDNAFQDMLRDKYRRLSSKLVVKILDLLKGEMA